eukprot:TRINITY_DN6237_c0_g1_i1.p1 TRINITY_DN6237_c0_g1~~TRINITY_DN6237_c0_g1_i1.p1  ORF type:complete len:837 (-),score=141.08 TRINITY_DN6237_c0_g1_i1:608-2995(-)
MSEIEKPVSGVRAGHAALGIPPRKQKSHFSPVVAIIAVLSVIACAGIMAAIIAIFVVPSVSRDSDKSDPCESHLPLVNVTGWYRFAHADTVHPRAELLVHHAVFLLAAFNHAEAARSFAAALALDPLCAACHWGIAVAAAPNINRNLTDDAILRSARYHAVAAADLLALSPAEKPVRPTATLVVLVTALEALYPESRYTARGWEFDVAYARYLLDAAWNATGGRGGSTALGRAEPLNEADVAMLRAADPDLGAFAAQAWMATSAWNYYVANDPPVPPPAADPVPLDWVPAVTCLLAGGAQPTATTGGTRRAASPLALHLAIHLLEPLRYTERLDRMASTGGLVHGANATAGSRGARCPLSLGQALDHLWTLAREVDTAAPLLDVAPAMQQHRAAGGGHLLHMPSHAALLLGRHADGLAFNARGMESDQAYFETCPPPLDATVSSTRRSGTEGAAGHRGHATSLAYVRRVPAWYASDAERAYYRRNYFVHKQNFLLWEALNVGHYSAAGDAAQALLQSRFHGGVDTYWAAEGSVTKRARAHWPLLAFAVMGDEDAIAAAPLPSGRMLYTRAMGVYARALAALHTPFGHANKAPVLWGLRTAMCRTATLRMAEWWALMDVSAGEQAELHSGLVSRAANLTLAARYAALCEGAAAMDDGHDDDNDHDHDHDSTVAVPATAAGMVLLPPVRQAAFQRAVALWEQAVAAEDAQPYGEPPLVLSESGGCLVVALVAVGRVREAVDRAAQWVSSRPGLPIAHLAVAHAAEAAGNATAAAAARSAFAAAWHTTGVDVRNPCHY